MRRLLELLFPPKSASAAIARERLKIVLAHERISQDAPDFLPVLQKELLAVVSRYVEIRPEMIRVNLGKSGETSLLEINVELDGGKIKPADPEPAKNTGPAFPDRPPGTIVGKFEPVRPGEPKPAMARAFEAGEPAPWVKPG
jgi:cell division topological specificity factor